jgi:hypothetical protein
LLWSNNVKIVTFPPHTSEIFQTLDFMFFGAFNPAKRQIRRNSAVSFIQDHAMRILRAFETAAVRWMVRPSFSPAGFLYQKNKMRCPGI